MYDEIKRICCPNNYIDSSDYFEFLNNLKYKNVIDIAQYEKFDCNEKKVYLIEKNLFIKGSKSRFQPYEDLKDYLDFKDFDTHFQYNNYIYDIKEDIIDEFYECIYKDIEVYADISQIGHNSFIDFKTIDFNLSYLLNHKQKLDFLNKEYNENLKIFLEHSHYHPEGINENPYLENSKGMTYFWKYFITSHFEQELFYYLTKGSVYNLKSDENIIESTDIISHWIKMSTSKKIMDYCKELISFLVTENINKVSQNNKNEKYYSIVFKGLDLENIFIKTLENLNAIDNNHTPIKRKFQPICDAIFSYVDAEYRNQIFKYNVDKIDFINFLKLRFPNTIKGEKLSDGNRHSEDAKTKLMESLKELKNSKENKETSQNKFL